MPVNPESGSPVPPPIEQLVPLDLSLLPPGALDALNPFASVAEEEDPTATYRVGELARRSGVAVGNIKFYVREGLLRPGQAVSKTQALYGAAHLRRLRTIRLLSEVGGLSLAQIGVVLEHIDTHGGALEVSRAVSYAVTAVQSGENARRGRAGSARDPEAAAAARTRSDAFVDALGLNVEADAPARSQFADALAALDALGGPIEPLVFTEHARLAYALARFEVSTLDFGVGGDDGDDPGRAIEQVAVGTVIFGAAFMALRAMAHEHETRRRAGSQEIRPVASDRAPAPHDPQSP